MKRLMLVLAALGAQAAVAHAETEFIGGLCFSAVTTACTNAGWDAGTCFHARYSPPIAANGSDTELSVFGQTFSTGFKLNSATPVSTTPLAVTMFKVARGGYSYTGSGFRFATHSPAVSSTTTSTPQIIFTGAFTNWDQVTGCTATFRGAVTRR